MMKLIDEFPLYPLLGMSIFLALAPFVPEPHLWEKAKMLFDGNLQRPVDIFDVFLHGLPLVVVAIKLVRAKKQKQ